VKFRLGRALFWILVPAVENKGPPGWNGCVGSVATRICWGFILAVGRSRSLNSVSAGVSKLCLGPSRRPLRTRGLLVATVCKLFSFGNIVTRVLFSIILLLV
jgi:hypothetical protein